MQPALYELEDALNSHTVVRHPFLQMFRDGALTKAQVTCWGQEQLHFSRDLANCFAAMYARIPDEPHWWMKRHLLRLIQAEAWGQRGRERHSSHFITLCHFLDIKWTEETAKPAQAYTRDFLSVRRGLCLNTSRPVSDALAAIAIANERINEKYIFAAYRTGIQKVPGLEACPTGYFDAHLRDEGHDFRTLATLYRRLALTDDTTTSARQAVTILLDARAVYFDHLMTDIALAT